MPCLRFSNHSQHLICKHSCYLCCEYPQLRLIPRSLRECKSGPSQKSATNYYAINAASVIEEVMSNMTSASIITHMFCLRSAVERFFLQNCISPIFIIKASKSKIYLFILFVVSHIAKSAFKHFDLCYCIVSAKLDPKFYFS